ncbi:MAG: 3-isopropylmalate dehydrogenase, partial [Acaryochloris sp. SU_5_25]|nr:3-isopropylmalate dehydrogenase [Acaryochloris sp. SU_5_25]
AMMLRYGLHQPAAASQIEAAVFTLLEQGYRTGDIQSPGTTVLGCRAIGETLIQILNQG